MKRDDDIHAITRVLDVIETLNENTVTSVAHVHRRTGLPKPTVVRILKTLVAGGYAVQLSRTAGYALSERILRLTAGFRYDDALVDFARPLMDAFTIKNKWLISIGTLDDDAMLCRYNTARFSPYTLDYNFLNRRLHIPDCAVGHVFLAFCSPAERKAIMAQLLSSFTGVAKRNESRRIAHLVATARKNGYATITRKRTVYYRNVAIPILGHDSGTAVGALTMSFLSSSLSEREAVTRFVPEMREIAASIAARQGALRRDREGKAARLSDRLSQACGLP